MKSIDKRLKENEATCKAILSLVKKSQKQIDIDQYKVRQFTEFTGFCIIGYNFT